jgi:hypothetical protein
MTQLRAAEFEVQVMHSLFKACAETDFGIPECDFYDLIIKKLPYPTATTALPHFLLHFVQGVKSPVDSRGWESKDDIAQMTRHKSAID